MSDLEVRSSYKSVRLFTTSSAVIIVPGRHHYFLPLHSHCFVHAEGKKQAVEIFTSFSGCSPDVREENGGNVLGFLKNKMQLETSLGFYIVATPSFYTGR